MISSTVAAAALALPSLTSMMNASFTARDFTHCHWYYSVPRPPSYGDCQKALDDFPRGHEPVTWYNEDLPEVPSQYVLPLVSTFRELTLPVRYAARRTLLREESS